MRPDIARLYSLVRAAGLAVEFIGQQTEDEFLRDSKTQEATRSTLITLGDMAKLLSQDVRDRMEDIPWHKVAGMRDLIVHNYDSIDWRIVYRVVKLELPPLIQKISRHLETLPKD